MVGTVVAPAPERAEPVIDFRDVCKRFGSNVIYDKMNLQVFRGETLTIIGGSGQGKSVCLKMMIGLLTPESGDVLYKGESVLNLKGKALNQLRRNVAYVFQGGALFDSMSVAANISYGLREHTKLAPDEIRARAEECISMVNLNRKLLDVMPSALSGGERKRVALARSIAIEPEVILYDEPTTGLDPKNITRIARMIVKLQGELGVTSVVVTHDMPTAHRVSDRIAMLHDKHFPFVGTADEMWDSPNATVSDFIHGNLRRKTDGA